MEKQKSLYGLLLDHCRLEGEEFKAFRLGLERLSDKDKMELVKMFNEGECGCGPHTCSMPVKLDTSAVKKVDCPPEGLKVA